MSIQTRFAYGWNKHIYFKVAHVVIQRIPGCLQVLGVLIEGYYYCHCF